MPRLISRKSARHLSILLPILLVTGCSEISKKEQLSDLSNNKFSVFTRGGTGKLRNKADDAKEHATIWDRMLSMYALPEIDNARIDREINWYLRNPEYLSRIQERAEPYLYFILNEIEAKKIPGELALLPVVESAFRPEAESPAQASGLWQFIPPTGRLYGLKQNSWYDGRRDVVESTQAATTFLKELSEVFNNDWLLALASYNAGKGNIKNAIDRNNDRGLPTDYWSLDLNNETSAYVPRLLAIAKIFANPEKYNLNLHQFPNEPYFELVDIQSQIDLGKAAEMAQTPIEHFFKLNPGFNRWSTDPAGPHRLLIPVGKADSFKEKLAELPHHERIKWVHHTVGKHENLKSIAKKHNSSMDEIAEVNHLDSNMLGQGSVLLIPISYQALKGEAATNTATNSNHNQTQNSAPAKQIYTTKKGDTLYSVALRNGVEQDDLLNWNKLSGKGKLMVGQKLVLKKSGDITVASSAPAFKEISYTVKSGDTLGQLSKKFNVDVADLRKWNNVPKNSAEIKPGVRLKLIVETSHPAS
ncbi:LysM peptidoglycan-binding domain-containing protein [Methylomonas paludis]|uniref:LysM peptidoglycan-binding domain-containing protein n=1 Tax=Methylomonas paludis TaxID=1173101 RepID=A0A975R9N3_9GAMM|nr:LysM peptidoglycan-binding domain-containing protein [Methylomonas paludis]QWF70371.1 LysM peptidoglycan-binding domain-containing protein [Methylomonas paludis]